MSWKGEQGQWSDLVVEVDRQKDHLQRKNDNLLWVGLAFTLGSTGHHVGLEEGALGDWSDNWSWKDFHLKEDMMVSQCLVNCCQYHLRHLEIFLQNMKKRLIRMRKVMIAIRTLITTMNSLMWNPHCGWLILLLLLWGCGWRWHFPRPSGKSKQCGRLLYQYPAQWLEPAWWWWWLTILFSKIWAIQLEL